LETYNQWKQLYPRDYTPYNNGAVQYCAIGQFEKCLEDAQEAMRRAPDQPFPYTVLSQAYVSLDRYAEARAVIEQGLARKVGSVDLHFSLYGIAALEGNTAEMQKEAGQFKGRPEESGMLAFQGQAAAYLGRLREGRELVRQATEMAERSNLREIAAMFLSDGAVAEAAVGNFVRGREEAARALAIARGADALGNAAIALAIAGEENQARPLIDEVSKRFPKATLVNNVFLPTVRATLEIKRGKPGAAVQLLEAATPFELSNGMGALYVRGLAYLRLSDGPAAAAQFRKILAHKGVAGSSLTYPLSYVGLARAYHLSGDDAKSRQAYQDFFALWKDADPDVPVLQAAKAEYEKIAR